MATNETREAPGETPAPTPIEDPAEIDRWERAELLRCDAAELAQLDRDVRRARVEAATILKAVAIGGEQVLECPEFRHPSTLTRLYLAELGDYLRRYALHNRPGA